MRSFRRCTRNESVEAVRRFGVSSLVMTSPLKKSLRAAERQRADVARARRRWIREQGLLDPARLVFIVWGIVLAIARQVLVEDDIERPMQAIFDGPVCAHDAHDILGAVVLAHQEIARDGLVLATLAGDPAAAVGGFNHNKRSRCLAYTSPGVRFS